MMPLIVLIEMLSFLSRPISHSVRLFANMLAGHITLKVFAGFITMLGAFGFLGWIGAIVPLALTVALTALEFLVAFLQAYVFAILTCIYLNDAIHPGPLNSTSTNQPPKRSIQHGLRSQQSIIGAGIACIGMGGAGVGVGTIFGHYLAAALRNPSAARRPVRQPDLRLRGDRGARHLLAR